MTRQEKVSLSATNVACGVGGREVISDVNLEVPAGSRLAVVGPNGAGKTTLLKVLAGITSPLRGSVTVDGAQLSFMRGRQRALTIGYVGQQEYPNDSLTVAEAVSLGRTPHRGPWAVADKSENGIIMDALAAVGLADFAHRACTDLSGGERHRVTIARALAQEVSALILDEPTNHLDAAWRLRLMALIDALPSTVIAAVHDLDLILRHFDLVAVVYGGTVHAFGAPTEVLTPHLIGDVFGVRGDIVTHPDTARPHLLLTEAVSLPHPPRRPRR